MSDPKRWRVCYWEQPEGTTVMDGQWYTRCGNMFEFFNEGPRANEFQFCPYCGRRLVER